MRPLSGACLLLTLLAAVAGCNASIRPIYSAKDSRLPLQSSQKDVQFAILKAGVDLGWKMALLEPGRIEGRIDRHGNEAVIDIQFDTTHYSITHKSTTPGLAYDERAGTVHKRYNQWVRNLDLQIQRALIARLD